MTITTTIERSDVEYEIEVTLSFHKGEPMSHEHPGCEDEIEIEGCYPVVTLTKEEEKKIKILGFKKFEKERIEYDPT